MEHVAVVLLGLFGIIVIASITMLAIAEKVNRK